MGCTAPSKGQRGRQIRGRDSERQGRSRRVVATRQPQVWSRNIASLGRFGADREDLGLVKPDQAAIQLLTAVVSNAVIQLGPLLGLPSLSMIS